MTEEKETQDEMIKMKVRTFIGLILSLIIGTNSFSIIYQKIQRNEDQIKYNKERSDRINKRMVDEADMIMKINNLERDLRDCKNSK